MASDAPDPYALSLRWLTRRAHSEADLRRRLQRKGCDEAAIEQALQRCCELGYIDDRQFAHQRAQQLWRQGRAVGPRLLQQLKQEGLSEALALEAMEQCRTEQSEQQLLTELVDRRYARLDFSSLDQRQRRRIVNYLQRRGFPLAMILDHLYARERQID